MDIIELKRFYNEIVQSRFDSFPRKVKFFYDWLMSNAETKELCNSIFKDVENERFADFENQTISFDTREEHEAICWRIVKEIASNPTDNQVIRFAPYHGPKLQEITDYVCEEYIIPVFTAIERELESTKSLLNEQERPIKVFISHSTKQKDIAQAIATNLNNRGIVPFVAHETIQISAEWQHEIENFLNETDVFVYLHTKDSEISQWVNQEIGIAYLRGVKIMTLSEGSDPVGFISKYQVKKIPGLFTYSEDSIKYAGRIICDQLTVMTDFNVRFRAFIFKSLQETKTYEQTQRTIEYIVNFKDLSTQELQILKSAKSNDYVINAYSAIEKIDAILDKYA